MMSVHKISGVFGRFGWTVDETQKIYEELMEIERETGKVTPERVLEKARSPESVMHEHIDWHDTSAAHSFRLIQASRIIRNVYLKVKVTKQDGPTVTHSISVEKTTLPKPEIVEVRAFAAKRDFDPTKQKGAFKSAGGVYVSFEKVSENPASANNYVQEAWQSLWTWYKRYKNILAVYSGETAMFNSVLNEIEWLSKQMGKPPVEQDAELVPQHS